MSLTSRTGTLVATRRLQWNYVTDVKNLSSSGYPPSPVELSHWRQELGLLCAACEIMSLTSRIGIPWWNYVTDVKNWDSFGGIMSLTSRTCLLVATRLPKWNYVTDVRNWDSCPAISGGIMPLTSRTSTLVTTHHPRWNYATDVKNWYSCDYSPSPVELCHWRQELGLLWLLTIPGGIMSLTSRTGTLVTTHHPRWNYATDVKNWDSCDYSPSPVELCHWRQELIL